MSNLTNRIYGPFVTGRSAVGILLLRAIAGMAFIYHGWGKIQNPFHWMGPDSAMPAFLQALAAISEFCGGLAWVFGLLTPVASFGIMCTMIVATFTNITSGGVFVGGTGAYELPLLYLSVAVLLLFAGPGVFSLDAIIFGRRPRLPKSP